MSHLARAVLGFDTATSFTDRDGVELGVQSRLCVFVGVFARLGLCVFFSAAGRPA